MTDFYDLARQFVCMIIAATLSVTIAVVDKMLPQRPEWIEKVALLEAQFRAVSAGETAGGEPRTASPNPGESADPASPGGDLQGLVDGYTKLLEFTEHIKMRGLMLDPDFCERVEREWSVKTLLSYMMTAETSLKEQAAEAHKAAASYLTARGDGQSG